MSSKPTTTVPGKPSDSPAMPPSAKLATSSAPTIPVNTNELDHSGSNYDKAGGKRVRKVPVKKVENWDEDA
jgi:hypothetical protein